MSGSHSGEVTPVPMPNTAVKLSSADGSWGFAPARVRHCQADIFIIVGNLVLHYRGVEQSGSSSGS